MTVTLEKLDHLLMRALAVEIMCLQKSYYRDDVSLVDDATYDKKFRMLQELEEQYPHLTNPNSPTGVVGN